VCAIFKSQAYVQKISAFAEVKMYIRDTLGKNTTDVLRTHNMDKTCILPAGILALVIRHAYRILSATQHIVLSVLSGCTIFFPHYLIKGMISEKKLLNIKCMFRLPLQILLHTLLIRRSIHQDIVNVRRCSCHILIILVRFQ